MRWSRVSLREKGVDLNSPVLDTNSSRFNVSLREKGVDLNNEVIVGASDFAVSLREKGVDLNKDGDFQWQKEGRSPFVRREWI